MVASTPPENADEVYKWLSRFISLEQSLAAGNFGLDRIKLLAGLAGHPEQCAPSIHVAGSKGKGSVTGMIASILEASGIKTARYASPHVSNFRERLSLGNGFFDEETYAAAGKELVTCTEEYISRYGGKPIFFELVTLWFFLCARLARCGAMAVETGMGGRFDATNILDPLASVITLIELEHTEYLGNTIAAIAGEKAGIIKNKRPLVLAEQPREALDVFRERAAGLGSPLFYFPECAELRDIHVDERGTSFTLILKSSGSPAGVPAVRDETLPGLFVPIPGEIQAKNAGLAVLALKTAFPRITNDAVYRGLSVFSLPARFERIAANPPVVLDGAHTKKSVEICLKTFVSLYGSGGVLIFSCAAGKDVLSIAELCVPCFSVIVITTPGTFRKSNPEEIYRVFSRAAANIIPSERTGKTPVPADRQNAAERPAPPEILFIPGTHEAVDRAVKLALGRGLPVLGTGSFYLAGEIRKMLKR